LLETCPIGRRLDPPPRRLQRWGWLSSHLGQGELSRNAPETWEHSVLLAGRKISPLRREHGLKPGTYLVKISSSEKDPNVKGGTGLNPALVRESIPALYNKESTLKVEIVAGGKRDFDLD